MKVLVVGSGGREHALSWKIAASPRVTKVYAAPGSDGMGDVERVDIAIDDFPALIAFAKSEEIDLTVIGPEAPLTDGVTDAFEAAGLRVFGPDRAGAQLEASKAFTKEILEAAGVPTASFRVFTDAAEARAEVQRRGAPIVIKADGLAAGKGVYVCTDVDAALGAIDDIMEAKIFGDAGASLVVEDFLDGEEASFIALTDGTSVLPMATSQDHKRIGEGDTGPNTGGMGAYSPAPVVTPELEARVVREVLEPVVRTMRERGIVFRGVLYAGLMIVGDTPYVLEFNVRFGDPECQPLMMRLQSDIVDLFEAVIDRRLGEVSAEWDERAAACVVVAAPGYPGTPEKGLAIEGLDDAAAVDDVQVFHAGTRRESGGPFVTAGGRVLGVTAIGGSIGDAVAQAYRATERIAFPGMQYRRDIGRRAIARGA